MNTGEFWELIGEANELADNPNYSITSPELIAWHTIQLLATRPPADIVAAQGVLDELVARCSVPDLRAAAHEMNGDDVAFTDFCGWLVLQGRRTFENAIADPDSLSYRADVRENAVYGTGLACDRTLTIPLEAYRKATGERRFPAPAEVNPGGS
ncbi:MAG TPA: DUF4240 domain-containing protein [Lentzea sp.]